MPLPTLVRLKSPPLLARVPVAERVLAAPSTPMAEWAVIVRLPDQVLLPPLLWRAPAPPTPAPLRVTPSLTVSVVPVTRREAPSETVVTTPPRAAALVICRVPALTAVVPV